MFEILEHLLYCKKHQEMLFFSHTFVSISEDKFVRMHLKGRPVPLYARSDLNDYDVQAPQDPPDFHLKLEWVYPSI